MLASINRLPMFCCISGLNVVIVIWFVCSVLQFHFCELCHASKIVITLPSVLSLYKMLFKLICFDLAC